MRISTLEHSSPSFGIAKSRPGYRDSIRLKNALSIDITLASVTVHVPADVGVELEMTRRMIASVDAGTLRRNGSLYVSANAATATRKLRIRAGATVGKLKLIHGAR